VFFVSFSEIRVPLACKSRVSGREVHLSPEVPVHRHASRDTGSLIGFGEGRALSPEEPGHFFGGSAH